MNSASLASDVPPGAVARKRIWSSFSMVGSRTTVAPFDSVHSVMPASGRSVVFTIVPGRGGASISARPAPASTWGSSRFADAAATIAASRA